MEKRKQISIDALISELVQAALEKNTKKVELTAVTLARAISKDNKNLAAQIKEIVGTYAMSGATRSVAEGPIPTDSETQLEILTVKSPSHADYPMPVLSHMLRDQINALLEERERADVLIKQGIQPTTRVLLVGSPGTGKTMLAHHIAARLNKKLVVLDIASAISSLLGRTGSNIKKVLKYAQDTSAVLLLDEFDAVAKRRDDSTDLGEIKRVVNVLLMELDEWPSSSLVIATSNHPEILDRAVWRRFDHVIYIENPGEEERYHILINELDQFLEEQAAPSIFTKKILMPVARLLEGRSSADVCRYANNLKRRVVLRQDDIDKAAFVELRNFVDGKEVRGEYCRVAKDILGSRISLSELSEITGLSRSGVNHHVSSHE